MASVDICDTMPMATLDKPEELGDIRLVSNDGKDHFRRWRPKFHLMGPHGWMNDPCALGYDQDRGQYTTGFQWNPKGNDWGDIAWGNATSKDLVSWTVSPRPSLVPSAPYDHRGVFTGCLLPGNIKGELDGTLTCFYTSVNQLPISFKLPYTAGCESLSIATSKNGGVSWDRYDLNPILSKCPDLDITGWRDPYVAHWPAVDRALGRREGKFLYGLISGGIRDETPTTFLYSIDSSSRQKWEYLGPLKNVGLKHQISRWSGHLGVNWEVTTFLTLSDSTGASREFLVVGAEGGPEKFHAQLWVSGEIRKGNEDETSKVLMEYKVGGIFDHGCLYAANSFWDPVTKEQIVIGWLPEDNLPDPIRYRQNWSGLLSLPRVLRLQCYQRAQKAIKTKIEDLTSFESLTNADGTYTVRTLGFLPDPRVEKLRVAAHQTSIQNFIFRGGIKLLEEIPCLPLKTLQWELEANIAIGPKCELFAIDIDFSSDHCKPDKSFVRLSFEPERETLTLENFIQNTERNIVTSPIKAPHTLLTYFPYPIFAAPVQEPLRIRAFFDQSALEIFVNDRTAISARVYPEEERCVGASFFALGEALSEDEPHATIISASVWDGLKVPRDEILS